MPSQKPSPNIAFQEFEHHGWQQVAGQYHDYFSTLTTQAIPSLLDAVLGAARVNSRVHLLDVATGPGYVAAAAAQRGASTVGVDFSTAMAMMAARQYPAVRFSVGDAAQLPFADASFNAVTANFGLLHIGNPDEALAEAHRVLKPGGRIGFTVWAKPEEAVIFGIVLGAIEAHGSPSPSLPPGPPFFRFSDPEESSRALLGAGFREPRVVRIPQTWRLRSAEELLEAMETGTVRTRGLLLAQSSKSLQAIRRAIGDAARAYEKDGGIQLPMPAMLASAQR